MDPVISSSAAPRPKSIGLMFVGAFLIFGLFAVAVQWMRASSDAASFDEEAIRAKQRYEILAKVKDENTGLTTQYAWADRAKGTVRLPVDRAMELTVAKLSAQGAPRPAGMVDPSVPHASALKPGGLSAPQPTPPPFASPEPTPAPEPVPAPPEPSAAAPEVGP